MEINCETHPVVAWALFAHDLMQQVRAALDRLPFRSEGGVTRNRVLPAGALPLWGSSGVQLASRQFVPAGKGLGFYITWRGFCVLLP